MRGLSRPLWDLSPRFFSPRPSGEGGGVGGFGQGGGGRPRVPWGMPNYIILKNTTTLLPTSVLLSFSKGAFQKGSRSVSI